MMIIVAKRILLLSLDVCRHASVYNAVAKSPRQWRSEGLTPSLSLTHFVGIFVTYRSVIVDGQVAFSSELPSPSLLSQPHKVVDLVPVGYTCTGISLPYTGTSTYTDGEWISLDLGRGRALECLGFALRSSEVCFEDYVCVCVHYRPYKCTIFLTYYSFQVNGEELDDTLCCCRGKLEQCRATYQYLFLCALLSELS